MGVIAFVLGACAGPGIYDFWTKVFGLGPQPSWRVNIQEWLENAKGILVNIAAVSSGAEPIGVICTLAVKVVPGDGYIYVSIDPTLVGFDFQDSNKKAVKVACDETGYPLDADRVGIAEHDVFFMVLAPTSETINIQAIDGSSAGAAMTLAIMAALENKRIKHGYIITGTIEEDGSIGEVGGIFYKVKAANDAGMSHFLVPSGQSVITMYRRVTRRIGPFQWVNYEPLTVDLNQYAREQGWHIEVQEVSTIEDAAEIMLE